LKQSGAVVARLVHTQKAGGAIPPSATNIVSRRLDYLGLEIQGSQSQSERGRMRSQVRSGQLYTFMPSKLI